jgi:hypothetical protein
MVEAFWPVRVWNRFAGLKINVVRAKYGTASFIDPTKWRYYDANH